jgi:ribosome-binding protein aMBF1 (putative translation factor)
MTTLDQLHHKWLKSPKYKKSYDALEGEYAFIGSLIDARATAGLTQAELALKMKTTQSAIARLEGGKANPSTRTLQKLAAATGTKLKITFEPLGKRGK